MAGLHPPEAGSGRVPIGDYRMTGPLKTLAALGVLLALAASAQARKVLYVRRQRL